MNRSHIGHHISTALILGALALAGCPGSDAAGSDPGGRRSPSPKPSTSPSPETSPGATSSASPSASPSGGLGGKTETGVATASPTPGRTPPAVKTVLVFPGSLTLTIPARDASRSLGLPAQTTVTALAQFADGTSTDSVSWSASSGVVSVSGSGVVTALATGTAVITATSVATPSASGTASVTVDDSGALDLTLN